MQFEVDLSPYYRTRKQGGLELTYVSWSDLAHAVNAAGLNWSWSLSLGECAVGAYLVGTLTVYLEDGYATRSAIAPINPPQSNFANPLEEAESAAFRRCWAKFGVGLQLWRERGK